MGAMGFNPPGNLAIVDVLAHESLLNRGKWVRFSLWAFFRS